MHYDLSSALLYLNSAPKMFGAFHIAAVTACAVLSFASAWKLRHSDRDHVIRLGGLLFLVSELLRQLYLYFIINGGHFDWWYFPFQLCSTPMYLALLFPYLNQEKQDAACTYLSTFALIASLCAFAYPQDMLKAHIPYTLNSFFWHGLMLFFSFFLILKREVRPDTFLPSLVLFLLFAAAALLVNIGVHACTGGSAMIDMFYINPYVSTFQPFFSTIEKLLGRGFEIVIYLAVLAFSAWLVYRLILMTRK